MASENRFIYYSTIHLSRREEILVQSIISLYNSKDDFKWIHKADSTTAVVIVGSEAKAVIKAEGDPFAPIKEQQIVCVLGDLFYPKNARAVIRIALPIKALHLVDRLSDIERNYINTPFTIEYVAANHVLHTNPVQHPTAVDSTASPLGKDGTIDFVPRKPVTDAIVKNEEQRVAEQPVISPVIEPTVKPDVVEPVKPKLELTEKASVVLEHPTLEQVEEKPVKDTVDYAPPKMALKEQPVEQTAASVLGEKVEYKEEVSLVPPTLTEIVAPEIVPPVLKTPVEDVQPKVTTEQPAMAVTAPAVAPTITPKQPTEAPPVVAEEADSATSRRIKLLRWPKSEVIQRHPGNAILASMVINVPMSVEDMAKQSDLPLAVCQRFMDAVIESKVAEYVDQIEENTPLATEQVVEKEEVSQRKGILYRIRAALGLLRK